ncbi:MAG: tRNA threonylcarbamoyladenosine dehydratase [Tenericutes bacterium]|nr:tRNA threonylcarbamoyladenosine dehydratase [Mycoplasmatota bacterium]
MRFDRFERIIGTEKIESLKHKRVAIFGLGGVGSYALEAIARSGVGKVIICDYDLVDVTNINRQLIAKESTIGMLKTEVAEASLKDINPNIEVLAFPIKADKQLILDILAMNPDFIIDAIDDVQAKTDLIEAAIKLDIPIIASMGFANKLHPELIQISTLDKTQVCPLAKKMRKIIKEKNITLNFPVVFSMEVPKVRSNEILGSAAYVPSVAGLMLASYVINNLIGE